jgi:hypothetical protein
MWAATVGDRRTLPYYSINPTEPDVHRLFSECPSGQQFPPGRRRIVDRLSHSVASGIHGLPDIRAVQPTACLRDRLARRSRHQRA